MTNNLVFNEEIKSYDLNKLFIYVERKYNVSRNSIKQYLKLSKRIEKCKNDIFFITMCLQNNILPNFTKFRACNKRLKSQPIYTTIRKLL